MHIDAISMEWFMYLFPENRFVSLYTQCICAKCRGRTLKVYVEDKCCVKYQTAHFEA